MYYIPKVIQYPEAKHLVNLSKYPTQCDWLHNSEQWLQNLENEELFATVNRIQWGQLTFKLIVILEN